MMHRAQTGTKIQYINTMCVDGKCIDAMHIAGQQQQQQ